MPIAPMRWDPIAIPDEALFVPRRHPNYYHGWRRRQPGRNGRACVPHHRSMQDEYFYNADGEMLFVPQQGSLRLCTEFGIIDIEPGEIAVIPRGVKIRVELIDGPARGYHLRKLRRIVHAARARADRRQLSRQSARLPDARRRIRG